MTSILTPIADKLGKMIRMLASDRDGDVVAAARAINRTLRNEGPDIHAFAESIGNGKLSEAETWKLYDAGFEAGRRKSEQDQDIGFRNVGAHDDPSWHDIAVECSKHPHEREQNFVRDMVRRTVHGGELSEKQAHWLRAIYARAPR